MTNIDAYLKNVHADTYRARGEAMGQAARWLGERVSRRFRRRTGVPADGVTVPHAD